MRRRIPHPDNEYRSQAGWAVRTGLTNDRHKGDFGAANARWFVGLESILDELRG